jgi:hypothetical protein
MNEHMQLLNRKGDEYLKFLLKERQWELQVLELNHRRMEANDLRSCRRSLIQAIGELELLLHDDPATSARLRPA